MDESFQINSSDRSPFDKPRVFYYETITEYYKKKAEQLFSVKNYQLAYNEYKGMLDCAIRDDNPELANEFENNLLKIESALSSQSEERENLGLDYNLFLKDNQNKNLFEKLSLSLKEFILTAKFNEEYYKNIDKIASFVLNKISSLDFQHAAKELLTATELILTFEPLKYILESGKIDLIHNKDIFLLFDLDSTLFDNSPRVYKILQDFIKNYGDKYPDDLEKLSSIKREDIIWGIKENLNRAGVINEPLVNHLVKFWFESFFSNEYIIDVPLKGALKFAQDADNLGIKILYLTGRFETMREGTVKNIIEHGFPLDGNSGNLILKPHQKIADHDFKHTAMENIKLYGEMLAGFDNEPINVNIFQTHFPKSEVFFLETNHSLNPPNLMNSIHSITDFSYKI
jgi:hypothetical protein